ncbi:MAG: GNAT family N-acetyltransferase [Lachnospiraceae bacterium]|nr:GNAT family N-acetyltransferase [Lachnospiraceae bacterium]
MENGGRGRTAGKTERGENRRNVRKGPWQVRLLAESEKAACRELWENIFAEDSKGFLDYYDEWKYRENECFGIFEKGRLVSMAQFNPYEMQIKGSGPLSRTVESRYVIAVATEEEYRHRGMMAAILREGIGRMREKGMPFVFLMPAAEAIYHPFGFRYFYEGNSGNLALGGAAGTGDGEKSGRVGADREPSVCPAVASDIPELVAFAEDVQAELFDCYTRRDRHYYEMLLAELASEGGGLLLVTESGTDGKLLATVPYWGTDPVEIREILCRPQESERVLFTLGRWFGSAPPGKRPERASVAGASFSMEEKKPVIMGRIADAVSFLELFSAERPVEVFLDLVDDLMEENGGIYRWRLSPEGSRAERLAPSDGEALRAAELAGGYGGAAGASSVPEAIRTTAAELFSFLMGWSEPEGVLREVRTCRKSYINEIV